jgi:ABC-2 type transport system ATP-binding protein
LNLEIKAGKVYGFLGPNGAGKTTTIRMIMALIRPTHGRALVYGQDVQNHPDALKRVGALVEGAAFYGYMSGCENLEVLAHTAGAYRHQQIADLLRQVGLEKSADKKVSAYSLGMKQRLGIAAALLGDPNIVILDEPTNGLDPAGIQEMREFIRNLARERGKTVFVSSHLLYEVEQISDKVIIINKGQLIREDTVNNLVAENAQLRIQASPLQEAATLLQERWNVAFKNGWLTLNASADESPDIVQLLVSHNIRVYQAVVDRQSLEDYFMEVTKA